MGYFLIIQSALMLSPPKSTVKLNPSKKIGDFKYSDITYSDEILIQFRLLSDNQNKVNDVKDL